MSSSSPFIHMGIAGKKTREWTSTRTITSATLSLLKWFQSYKDLHYFDTSFALIIKTACRKNYKNNIRNLDICELKLYFTPQIFLKKYLKILSGIKSFR